MRTDGRKMYKFKCEGCGKDTPCKLEFPSRGMPDVPDKCPYGVSHLVKWAVYD